MLHTRSLSMLVALALAGGVVGCFVEDSGECSIGAPCKGRGEACDDVTKTCEPQNLDVDGTAPAPAPADFTRTLPFFRGKVCMPTKVQPGNKVPVQVSMCVHTCVTANSYQFKNQYRCTGTVCEAALIVYTPDAAGTGCPADVFGKFPKSDCQYVEVPSGVGGFTIQGIGDITGTATVELPFLTNDDVQTVADGASTDANWATIYKYPQDPGRVFNITMSGSNPAAPANCVDDPSLCDCKEIGF